MKSNIELVEVSGKIADAVIDVVVQEKLSAPQAMGAISMAHAALIRSFLKLKSDELEEVIKVTCTSLSNCLRALDASNNPGYLDKIKKGDGTPWVAFCKKFERDEK
jgi:hypothetical protein